MTGASRRDSSAQNHRGRRSEVDAFERAAQQQKTYSTILDEEIEEAVIELERPRLGLALSGLSAGLDVGFSALFVALVVTMSADSGPTLWTEIVRANAYAVGFVLVIFGRSELFTEHATLAVLPVLGGKARLTNSSGSGPSSMAPISPAERYSQPC